MEIKDVVTIMENYVSNFENIINKSNKEYKETFKKNA